MAMNVALARLVGFCLDIGLSVIYTGLFVGALRAWNRRRKNTDVSSVIPGVLIAMFILNAGQLCLQGVDAYDAFFRPPQDPIEYYNRFDSRILPSRDGIFWLLSILTDVLMIWRLYVVWLNSVRIIILPLGLLTAGIATGVVMFVYTIGRMYENSIHLSPEVDRWWMITLGFTIALNILTPTLIVARLWYIARHIGVLGSRSSHRSHETILSLGK